MTDKKSSLQKSKSMTSAEIAMANKAIMDAQDMAAAMERLKTEEPPASLDEARQRRASIKQQRRDSINLIRSRTASRASAIKVTKVKFRTCSQRGGCLEIEKRKGQKKQSLLVFHLQAIKQNALNLF
jgi:hypothetical protein